MEPTGRSDKGQEDLLSSRSPVSGNRQAFWCSLHSQGLKRSSDTARNIGKSKFRFNGKLFQKAISLYGRMEELNDQIQHDQSFFSHYLFKTLSKLPTCYGSLFTFGHLSALCFLFCLQCLYTLSFFPLASLPLCIL